MIQLSDLTVGWWGGERDDVPTGWRERPATESDLLSVLTDEALIQELVKRGKLHREKAPAYMVAANMSDETWLERAVTDWEPVGSGDLFDVIRFVGPP